MLSGREEYRHKMETQMKEWGARLDAQNAKLDKAAVGVKAELKKQVDELQKLQASAKEHFAHFVASSSDQWKNAKAGLEQSWTKISSAVEAAWKKVASA
jgi:Zn-dependent M32 family carboxypeptidase